MADTPVARDEMQDLLRKILEGEFAKELLRSRVVGPCCIFRSPVLSKVPGSSLDSNAGDPLSIFHRRDALIPRRVVLLRAAIVEVLRVRPVPKIGLPIVQPVPIDVINIHPLNPPKNFMVEMDHASA